MDHPVTPAAHVWAAELVEDWNGSVVDKIEARLNPDVLLETMRNDEGAPGGILASGRASYMRIFPEIRATVGPIALVSALGDAISASLVLRNERGILISVLVSFDDQGRIRRMRSYAREVASQELDRRRSA